MLTPLISSITRRHWHQVGANVAKFCRDTARLAVLDNDKKQTSILRSVAGWHEKQGENFLSGTQQREQRQESIKQELKAQGIEVLRRRQERMRELLQEERRNFEGELRSLGLSIADADRSYKVG